MNRKTKDLSFCLKEIKTVKSEDKKIIEREIVCSKYRNRVVSVVRFYKPISKMF